LSSRRSLPSGFDLWIAADLRPHRRQVGSRRLVFGEAVEHEAAVLPLAHEPRTLRVGEVRRYRGGREVENGRHLADAQISPSQHGQESEPDGVSKGFQDGNGDRS